jgi:uncharacterized protein YdeI (YjbR/CyaY-like superfamily)
MAVEDDLPILAFQSVMAWEKWLAKEHAKLDGLWLKIAKKSSGVPTVTYAEALEVALCYGWIDGQKGSFDHDYFLQRFTPRRARSKWSKVNCVKVDALIKAGKMKPAGLSQVEAAKADGRWDAAYASQSTAEIPEDFAEALSDNAIAREFFETLSKSQRYPFLFRIQDAKRPETRQRRIAQFVELLAEQRLLR